MCFPRTMAGQNALPSNGVPGERVIRIVARRLGVGTSEGECLCFCTAPVGCRWTVLPECIVSLFLRDLLFPVFSNRVGWLGVFFSQSPTSSESEPPINHVPDASCRMTARKPVNATPRERHGSRSGNAGSVDVVSATCDFHSHKAAHIFCTRTRSHCCESTGQGRPIDSLVPGPGKQGLPAPAAKSVVRFRNEKGARAVPRWSRSPTERVSETIS